MAKLGDVTATGFIVDFGANGVVGAGTYTPSSTFTPDKIRVSFGEQFGVSGTVYAAVYTDNAGVPGTMLFSGSATYASLFSGIKDLTVTGSSLTSGTSYWVAVQYVADGTYNIDNNANNSVSNQNVKSWTEGTPGSWTNNPTLGADAATDIDLGAEANNVATTTTSTSTTVTTSSTSTTSTTRSTSTTSTTRSTSTTSTSSSTSTTTSTTSSTSTTSTTSSTSTTSTTTSTTTTSTSTTTTSTSTTTSLTSTSSSTTQTWPYFLNASLVY